MLSIQQSNSKIPLYLAAYDFKPVDEERQLTLKQNETHILCLKKFDEWIYGCPDYNPNLFGFVPENYVKYINDIEPARNDV